MEAAILDAPQNPSPPLATPPVGDGVERAKVPEFLYVLDTTAIPGHPARVHEMIVSEYNGHKLVKSFTFEPGKPTKLAFPIAIKFLRIAAFRRTDEHGEMMPYHRQPKQPHEMGAGERFELADHQTVADYHELSNMALLQRALELPGGELVRDQTDRQSLIGFLVKAAAERRKATEAKAAARRTAIADEPDLDLAEIDEVTDED